MSLLRWSRALLAALVLAGCKSNPPSTSPQDSGVAAAPAADKAPTPGKEPGRHGATGVGSEVTPPPRGAPGHALSYLKPVDPERCEWVRQPLPAGEPVSLFTFNAACDQAMVSWRPDGTEGLVFSWPAGEGEGPRAWRVELVGKAGKPLELKGLPGSKGAGGQDRPYIEEIGFDEQGHPVAIVADAYVTRTPKKGAGGQEVVTFEGKDYPLPEGGEGSPGLALAYRLEGAGWKRIEAKGSHFESDLAEGTRALEATKTLLPIAKSSPSVRMRGEDAPEGDAKRLDAAFPGQDESGQWMVLATPGGRLFFRGTLGGEFLYPSVPLAWEQEGKLVELEGLMAKRDDVLDLQLREGLLLIANYGDPRSAQIWDTRAKQPLLSVEAANAPAFWPRPGSP
ncbi:MAG: hypothetical protein JXB05_02215 [Myxococcaceae bacterium]|nr:hypothetical protein [Myxococcaceae bacterium]